MYGAPVVRRLASGQLRALVRTGLAAPLALGCSVATAEYSTTEATGSTHAVVEIQRVDQVDGSSRGDALAGFVRLPASAERSTALALVGLARELPGPGECRVREFDALPGAVSELSRIELLDAASVELLTTSGAHELVPHAFPTVTDWIRGVVHTSRDRSSEQLPPGAAYHLVANNIESVGSLDAWFEGPRLPSDVTVDGLAWADAARVRAGAYLDFTWSTEGVGPDDTILISLEHDGQLQLCGFADAEGAGSLALAPAEREAWVGPGDDALIAIHRVRSLSQPGPAGLELVAVRFDFSLARAVVFE